MKKNRFTLLALLLLASALLSACGAAPAATWPGLSADVAHAYLANGSYVYGIDLASGDQVWRYPDKAEASLIFYAAPALLPDGRLLAGSAGTNSCMHIIDPAEVDGETGAADGRCFFAGAHDHWVAAPLVVGDTAYAPNNDGSLYAINLNDGSLAWSLKIGGHLWSSPVTDGSRLYLASLDHYLYAVDLESRSLAWKTDLGGSVPASPALSPDGATLYAGSFASRVFALDTASGNIQWSEDTADWVWGTPASSEESLYYADLDGFVYSLDVASGRQNWGQLQPDAAITAAPLVVDGLIVFVTESGSVFAYDADGEVAWEPETGGKIYTPPVASGEFVLVAPYQADSPLIALDLNGRQAWTFEPEN